MLSTNLLPSFIALCNLLSAVTATPTASVERRVAYDHGSISVEVLGSDKGIYSKLKVKDSLSTTLNGAPIPTTE